MAYDAKKYVDIAGLQEFLRQIVWNLQNNTTTVGSQFSVANALNAVKATYDDADQRISTTYLKTGEATDLYASKGLKIGDDTGTLNVDYVTLGTDISKAQLQSVLKIASDGAEANVLEGVKFKGSGGNAYTDLAFDSAETKKVLLDLSTYALKSDITDAIASVFKFRGTVANSAALPASGNVVGDVYHVITDDGEYVWVAAVDGGEAAHWEPLGSALDLSNYYTKSETYSQTEVDGLISDAKSALTTKIEAIYKAGTGGAADTGVLANEITRATTAEAGLDSRLDVLEGADTVSGSVAKSIKDAIDALDYSGATSGDYVTQVTESNGVIAVTRASKGTVSENNTGLVDGGTVYTAIGNFKESLVVSSVGADGSYLKTISETDGKISAAAQTFDTVVGSADGTGAATNNNAPTTLAVRTELNSLYAAIGSVTTSQIDGLFTRTDSGSGS